MKLAAGLLLASMVWTPSKPSIQPPAVAAHAALQRSAAATDDALDVYRLALVELLPALRSILATAHDPHAHAQTALRPASLAALARINLSVQRRISADSLSPLPRAYHHEAVAALVALSEATGLAQVLAPCQQLLAAWQGFTAHAAALAKILDRPHPTVAAVHQPSTLLDEVNEALQQLALAEENIAAMRARHASQGEILQGFMRLEIDLRHALDLIYSGAEVGLHIGFDMAHAIAGMEHRISSVQAHLATLVDVVEQMAQRPAAVGADLLAQWSPLGQPHERISGPHVKLSWAHDPNATTPVSWRLYRRWDNDLAHRDRLTTPHCGPEPEPEVTSEVAPGAVALAELSADQGAYVDPFAQPPRALPQYRLVAVSPFGSESRAAWRSTVWVPDTLQPPTGITAVALAPAYDDPNFYVNADAVRVQWQLSASDVSTLRNAHDLAMARKLPEVSRYDIYRRDGRGQATEVYVGHVAAGVAQWVDHPGAQALRAGVRYLVEAKAPTAFRARLPDACAFSSEVVADVRRNVGFASAGGGYVDHPAAWERSLSESLEDPVEGASARASFERRDLAEQQDLKRRFWRSASPQRRRNWYDSFLVMSGPDERSLLSSTLSEHLAARDVDWVLAEIFLADNPGLSDQPEQYWALLDPPAQAQALRMFESKRNRETVAYYQERQKDADARTRHMLQRPMRVLAWWHSRDPIEMDQQQRAWRAMTVAKRRERVLSWLQSQPRAVAKELSWPDWEQLSLGEQQAWHEEGYQRMFPSGLWPALLAWTQWQFLDPAVKVAALAEEVRWYHRLAAWAAYTVRPLDAFFHFKLLGLVLLLLAGMLSGYLLLQLMARPDVDPKA